MDFNAQSLTVTLSANNPRDCVHVAVIDDQDLEPSEIFTIVLTTNHINATISVVRESATVTIIDNEPSDQGWDYSKWV